MDAPITQNTPVHIRISAHNRAARIRQLKAAQSYDEFQLEDFKLECILRRLQTSVPSFLSSFGEGFRLEMNPSESPLYELLELATEEDYEKYLKQYEAFPIYILEAFHYLLQRDTSQNAENVTILRDLFMGVSQIEVDAFNFISENTQFIDMTQLFNDGKDIGSGNDETVFENIKKRFLEIASVIDEGVHATQFLQNDVKPFYIERLGQLVSAGLALDKKQLFNRLELIDNIVISIAEFQSDSTAAFFSSLRVYIGIPRDALLDREDLFGHLIHELNHLISATSLMGISHVQVGLNRTDEPKDPIGFERALNEAFTESLALWIESDKNPDFSNMPVAEFFEGPKPYEGSYFYERLFFVKTIGKMKIGNLTKAYFEDLQNHPHDGATTKSYIELIHDIESESRMSFEGLSELYVLVRDNGFKGISNLSVEPNAPKRFMTPRRKLALKILAPIIMYSNAVADNPKYEGTIPLTSEINMVWDGIYMPMKNGVTEMVLPALALGGA